MEYLLVVVGITVFALMLTIGINHSLAQLTSLWKDKGALLWALIAAVVLVPAAAFVLLRVFNLTPAVVTALALLAAAPGAPLTTKRSQMAGADGDYVSSVQLSLALLAVIVTPLIIAIFDSAFSLTTGRISPLAVAGQVAQVTLLPVVLGLLLRWFAPGLAARIAKPLNMAADLLFILMILALIVFLAITPALRDQLLLGWPAISAIFLMAVIAVVIGHLLGGPRNDRRSGLAIACLARNIGLAIFIAGLSDAQQVLLPAILAYMLIGTAVQVPYAVWIKRR